MLHIHHLTCNDFPAPLGIDDPRPNFAWQLSAPERGQKQSAYRVLVASSPKALAAFQGDIWDSDRVASGESVQVRYGGRALFSGQRAWWMVKVWDQDGLESAWSEPAAFEMGLLRQDDWQGQWIAHPEASWEANRPAPYFRKTFYLKEAPGPARQARAYICGLGYYELYLNGQRLGESVLDPAFTRYDRRALYVTYDIGALLRPGENVFGVILGNGFYNQAARDAWDFEKSPWRAAPRLLFQASIEQESGSLLVTSDASWKVGQGPLRFDGTRLGEVYDARLELSVQNPTAWSAPGWSDTDWLPARIVEGPRGQLCAQSLPPARVMRTLRPARLWKSPSGSTVFDMGQNFSGWARLRVSGPAGAQVTLRYGERITPEGALDMENIAALVFEGEFQTDRYILKGAAGEEVYEPRFTYHGFQYVEVVGAPGELTLDSLEGRVVHTSFARAGSFACSDERLNRLQECTEWAYISNFTGYPTDCPHREKNGWTGDAHLAAETGLYNYLAAPAYRKWLDDMIDEQREDGALPGIVPTSGWGYQWGNGPCWDSAAVLIPWYLYLYRGDRAILERCFPMIQRYMEYLGEKSEGGLPFALGLGDWVPPFGRWDDYTAPLTLLTSAYFYLDARTAAKIAALLGHTEQAGRYEQWANTMRERFNAMYYDPLSGLYAGGTQTAQAMALYAGLTDARERPRAARQLVAEIRQQKGRINAGIHGAKAALNALAENNFPGMAYHLITQPRYPGWVWWLEQGATTLWETWDGKASRNHIMFGDISAWFYKYLAGIMPDPQQPGFQHTIIRPFLAEGLAWVRAEHESPYGTLRSAWQRAETSFRAETSIRTETSFRLEVSLPANTSGEVTLPRFQPGSLRVNGALAQAQKAHQKIGSGDWLFECTLPAIPTHPRLRNGSAR